MSQASPEKTPESSMVDNEQLELKLPGESSNLKDLGLWAGVLALLTLISFWQATGGAFTWRDSINAQERMLYSPGGLSTTWFYRWQNPQNYGLPTYQPVALTAYWLEYRAGGRGDQGFPSPMAYHVASLIFNAIASVLLWLLLRELLIPGSWLIAAIFALHPLHAEPVSWISEQGTVLAGMFFIASIYCYFMFITWRERDLAERATGKEGVDPAQTWGFYAGSAACFLLAILSDPSAVVLPLVLMILLWWKKRFTSQDGLLVTPMAVIAAGFWISTADLHNNPMEENLLHTPLIFQAVALGRGMWFCIDRLLVPVHFSVLDFAMHQITAAQKGFYIFIVAAVIAPIGVLFAARPRRTGVIAALASFALLVLSGMNWFDATRLMPLTDCVAYLAMIPIIALMVVFISRLKLPGPHPQTVVSISTAVLIIFGLISWMRAQTFENSTKLWADVVQKDPDSAFGQASLAEQLRLKAIDDFSIDDKDAMSADRKQAIEHAEDAVELNPQNAAAQQTWANTLVEGGEAAAAMEHFQKAIELAPNSAPLRSQYAAALILLGRFQPAIPELNHALTLDPTSSNTHRLLGEAYEGMHDIPRAMIEQQAALYLNRSDFIARQKLADMQAATGKPDDLKHAAENYALILADENQRKIRGDIWLAVARITAHQGDLDSAKTFLQTASSIARDDPTLLKKIDAELESVQHMAATRPSTRSSTQPTNPR